MDRILRILLIEDNPGDADLIEEMLNESDVRFVLTCTERLSTGIDQIKAGSFDVILLDLGLPDSQGLGSLIQVKAVNPDAPVIVLTGLSEEAVWKKAVKEGAQDYLIKGQIGRNLLVRSIAHAIDRKRMEEIIRHQAFHDSLTGLPNKTLFLERLKLEISQARRDQKKLAILFLDIDRFKNINDTLGHDVGDQLLIQVAARFRDCVRECDTVSRIGGDEFIILLADIAQSEDVTTVAEKLIKVVQQPFTLAGIDMHVTASIGISLYPDDNEIIEDLIRYADIAMYHAKELGRNTYQFYNYSINTMTLERVLLENSLRGALERGEFSVLYQPQIDVVSRKIIGTEALLRWNHPELGILNPEQFIPLAECTGLIVPIGEWVVRTACAQNKAWQEAGFPSIRVSVNLSFRQFRHPELVEMISRVLEETGLDPKWLDLEITENTAMHDMSFTAPALRELTAMGVNLSLDDFGTGYLSLTHIQKLPIWKIKIDRSFIGGLKNSSSNDAIVKAVIALTHNLGFGVVAEGVETWEQFLFLQSYGCDEIQGYLFGKPLTAKEIESVFSASA